MHPLTEIQKSGFDVMLIGDTFMVSPASSLTTTQRDFIKAYRQAILAKLIEDRQAGANELTDADRQKILAYLAAIGETDQELIAETLEICGRDTERREWALKQADKVLGIQKGDYTGLVQCSGCNRLEGDQCPITGFRYVIEVWRTCDSFVRK